MKVLLQHRTTRLWLDADGKWSPRRRDAANLASGLAAVQTCHTHGFKAVDMILISDDNHRIRIRVGMGTKTGIRDTQMRAAARPYA